MSIIEIVVIGAVVVFLILIAINHGWIEDES